VIAIGMNLSMFSRCVASELLLREVEVILGEKMRTVSRVTQKALAATCRSDWKKYTLMARCVRIPRVRIYGGVVQNPLAASNLGISTYIAIH
jgi:hypothetical protein